MKTEYEPEVCVVGALAPTGEVTEGTRIATSRWKMEFRTQTPRRVQGRPDLGDLVYQS